MLNKRRIKRATYDASHFFISLLLSLHRAVPYSSPPPRTSLHSFIPHVLRSFDPVSTCNTQASRQVKFPFEIWNWTLVCSCYVQQYLRTDTQLIAHFEVTG
jgi:hypothetical protein